MTSKEKLAVLGSGVGAMSTLLELTSVPGWQDRYDLTVYQMGWRLGGKGASGRDRAVKDRILEHGLHLWMGFYENAFRQMRDAYREWNDKGLSPAPAFRDYLDAFSPRNYAPAMDNSTGEWQSWLLDFPANSMKPGEDLPDLKQPLTVWDLALRMLGMLLDAFLGAPWHTGFRGWLLRLAGKTVLAIDHWIERSKILSAIVRWLAGLAGGRFALPLAHAYAHTARGDRADQESFVQMIDDFLGWLEKLEVGPEHDEHLRRVFIMCDTAFALLRGLIRDEVATKGYDQLDDRDFMEWLASHGCHEPKNAITTYFYDACFAYRKGRNEYQPGVPGESRMGLNLAAGATLYGMLRLVGSYKGALMYTMGAGMGDTIFSPYYVVLKNRGVKFRFFHKVLSLGLSTDRTLVDRIDMAVQAKVKPEFELRGYDPIFASKGVPSWPAEPFWDQLQDADTLKKGPCLETYWDGAAPKEVCTLVRGVHFDRVVLGISVGALPFLCGELAAANPRWREMTDRVETVKTQAMQLWLHKTMAEVGWDKPAPILTGYVEPHDTWCNMDHLIERERWTAEDRIRQIAYFCNVMQECQMPECSAACTPQHRIAGCPMTPPFTDTAFPAGQKEIVRQNSIRFLKENVGLLWPKFHFGALYGGRFEDQFWRVNVDPSERYVQSIAGSTAYRLPSGDSGFANLVLAGDWTYTSLNLGCVEAAVISGKMASHAICGKPDFIYGPLGYPEPIANIRFSGTERARKEGAPA